MSDYKGPEKMICPICGEYMEKTGEYSFECPVCGRCDSDEPDWDSMPRGKDYDL
jgi:tRNA(Ile2) C34 agmatinyltransferase TiaS